MAGSLQGYKNSLLAGMGDQNAQQAIMSETPGFNMFANTNQTNVPGMDILSPTERRNQEYDSNAMRTEALNKEVEIGLGSRIDPVMSDSDKQRYLNSLTKSQYNQMLKYKNEGYGFMASKELLENSYKLADPNATGLMKYKDYADKDAYYYNNANNGVSDFIDRYITNPIGKVSKWWNEDLGFAEDAQNGNMNFVDRFANLTLGNIINGLDTAVKGVSGIVDEGESKVKSLYDKVVKGYDTDWDFYDKDREETIVDKIIDTAYGAGESVLGAVGLIPNPVSFGVAAGLSTKPGEKLGGLTIGTISKLVDETLSLPGIRAGYNLLSDDSKDKVSTGLAMIITGKAAKAGGAKLSAKAEPYIRTTKEMVQNGLNKGAEYAKVQADFENFSKTKGWTERADGTFVETENYNPGYRGRVASEFWEGFKEGVKEKFNNPNGTNLSEIESTTYQEVGPGTTKTTGGESVNKTNTNNTQSNGIVNTIGASQLRQWNKMNKVQGIKFANRYGTDYGTWMVQRGFNQSYDNNINQLIDYDKYMQNQKRQALGTITQRYREPAVDDMLLEAINRAEYIKSDDLGKLQNLALKNEQGGLTPSDIDYVRQWFGYNFPLRFDGTDIAGTTQRNNNMYTRVKDVLERIADENGIPQLREINREIAATHHIIEGTTRYYNGLATNDIISLKDLITLASTVANPNARPLFIIQQAIKMPKVKDTILSKLIKGKTTEERNQIKIDFDKIRKIQDEAEQRRMIEEWIAKWNLKVEEATKAMQNRLPENITQGGVVAGDRGFMATYGDGPTYQELGLGKIRETASPQFLLRAIIEQLKEANLIKDINTAEAINQILSNLSPEAQAKLAQIANKLANGRELTPEEGKVVEKLADIIRQDQDTITDVQQPGLFDGLDNGEPTDINNTNLPTNPTNNGGSTEGGNPGEGGLGELSGGETTGKAKANDGTNGGGDKGRSGEGVNQLGTPKSTDGVGEEIIELGDVNDAYQLIDNLLGNSKYSLSSPSERGGYRTFTNRDKNAAISIDGDGNIVEFIQSDNAPKGAADELLLHAIEQGANKIDVDYNSVGLISKLRVFGFYPLSKAGWGDGKKYYLAHNGDPIDTIRQNIGGNNINERLSHIKWFNTYREAAEYRNEFIKDNEGYELTDEEGWDGLKNYKEFNKNFKTQADIKKYIDDTFKGVDSHVSNDIEDLFNKSLAMARQAYNGNKNTQDLSIIYALLSELPEDVLGRYWRPTNTLTFGKEGFTPYHELTHYSDYFLGRELTGSEVKLSAIANQIKNRKRPKNIDIRAELIWDFAEIFKEIDKWAWHGEDVSSDKGYTEYAWEILARRGEAFYSDIQGKGLISMDGEMFPRKISTMYAKWLGKVNIARAKGELYDGTLQEISDLVRRKVVLSIPGVGNVRGMKVGILKDGKTVGIKDVELSENSDKRGYHGSSASFDKFDSTHMGEGEGAQVHGWGHYIAVNEGTAENYAKLKERRYGTYDFTIDGRPYREVYNTLSPEQKDIFDTFKAVKVNDRSFEESWDYIENKKDTRQYNLAKKILSEMPEKRAAHPEKPKEYYDMIEEDVKSYIDSYEKYEKDVQSLRDRVGTSSNLYDVEIPDPIDRDTPTGKNYLEEKDLMSSDAVQDFVYRFSEKYPEKAEQFKGTVWSNSAHRGGRVAGWEMYVYLTDALGGMKQASKFLENLGYDGIHYFGNRDGEAYVIFNDDAIDIKSHKTL